MTGWFSKSIPATGDAAAATGTAERPASGWIDAFHIVCLANFGVAQPIYDRLTERPVFLVDLHVGPAEIICLVILISIVLPVVLVSFEWLVRRLARAAYPYVHLALVAIFSFLCLMPVVKLLPLTVALSFCGGVVSAVVCTWWYSRYRQVRQLVSWAGLGILIFPIVFLVRITSGISASLPTSSRAEDFSPAPVVMLILDEFCGSSLMTPDRQIDEHRFPNFAALARETTWFRNASAVHHFTEQAVPAILTGRYPTSSALPFPSEFPQHLFSVLHFTGEYDQAAFEPLTRFAGRARSTLRDENRFFVNKMTYILSTLARIYLYDICPTDFGQRLPQIPRAWFGLRNDIDVDPNQLRGTIRYSWGDHRNAQFDHFLRCFDGSLKPTIYFMHLLQPHVPWSYLPSGRRYAADGYSWEMLDLTTHGPDGDVWGHDELEVVQSQQRYLLQLMHLDRQIGRLIARLKESGLYDECLLIVTADHGISFRTNQPRRQFGTGNVDEILSIPLFVKRPRQVHGGTSDRVVESVDILPTIADVVGIDLHSKSDGWSVFDTTRPERQQQTYAVKSTLRQVDPQLIQGSALPDEIRKRFGNSSDPLSLYRIGPVPELIGRSLDSLHVDDRSPTEIQVFRYGDRVDPAQEIQVPCWYEGLISTPRQKVETSTIVAVAINGTIQAVTRTYQQPGFLNQWAAMVPESAFRDGSNEVRFYTVEKTEAGLSLTPCVVTHMSAEEIELRNNPAKRTPRP